MVIVEGYLTEAKLAVALEQIAGESWAGGQVTLPGSRRRWDMAFKRKGTLVLVEYDGDEHYCHTLKIKGDHEKDKLARENGMSLIRVPYWVQLDNITVRHYFGIEAEIEQSFPHGFITTKFFPASFCELGIARFMQELQSLPPQVKTAVVESLRERVKEHGLKYVMPLPLRDLITA
jgi:hypothetical protein